MSNSRENYKRPRTYAFIDFSRKPKNIYEEYMKLKKKINLITETSQDLIERREKVKLIKKEGYDFFALVGIEATLGIFFQFKRLACPFAQVLLFKFLDFEFGSENLLSYIDCLEYINAEAPERETPVIYLIEILKKINNTYISNTSSLELNMPSNVSKSINESFQNLDTIDEIKFPKEREKYLEAVNTLKGIALNNLTDSYFRFMATPALIDIMISAFSNDYAKKKEKALDNGLVVTLLNKQQEWDINLDEDPCILVETYVKSLIENLNLSQVWNGSELKLEAFQNVKNWRMFVQGVNKLQKIKMDDLTNDEYLSFLINIYNLLMIHIYNLNQGLSFSDFDVKMVSMKEYGYEIGGEIFSPQKIENLLLKGKRTSLSFIKKKENNKRNFQTIPETLFSLINLSSNSPTLQPISPNKLKEKLIENTSIYLHYNVKIDHVNKKVIAPSIFLGHKQLFSVKGETYSQSVKNYIERYMQLPNYNLEFEPYIYNISLKVCLETRKLKKVEYVDQDTFKETIAIYNNEIQDLQNNLNDMTLLYKNSIQTWESKEKEYQKKIMELESQIKK